MTSSHYHAWGCRPAIIDAVVCCQVTRHLDRWRCYFTLANHKTRPQQGGAVSAERSSFKFRSCSAGNKLCFSQSAKNVQHNTKSCCIHKKNKQVMLNSSVHQRYMLTPVVACSALLDLMHMDGKFWEMSSVESWRTDEFQQVSFTPFLKVGSRKVILKNPTLVFLRGLWLLYTSYATFFPYIGAVHICEHICT